MSEDAADAFEVAIAALWGEMPADFVAKRDALAAELTRRGDQRAREVAKLRRPNLAVWALNQLARSPDDRAILERLLEAAAALRHAQERGDAAALRVAMAEERTQLAAAQARACAAAERGGGRVTLALERSLRDMLHAAAVSEGPTREALLRGMLTGPPAAHVGFDGVAEDAEPVPTARAAPAEAPSSDTDPRAEARALAAAAEAAFAHASAEAQAANEALLAARRALDDAREEAARTARDAARTSRVLDEAKAARAKAQALLAALGGASGIDRDDPDRDL
jgi:hypothetical protein